MSLSKLPYELMLAVADTLPTDSLSRFLRTCRSIHQLLAPELTARITTEELALNILKCAISRHNHWVLHLALSHSAPWHTLGVSGICYSALQEACNRNQLDTATAPLRHFGSTIITANSLPGGKYCHVCPLKTAIQRRNLPLTTLLLEHGAPANQNDIRGHPRCPNQPLDFVGKDGSAEIAEVLIKHGANVRRARRALGYAMDKGRWEVAKVLLHGGVNVWGPNFPWTDRFPLGNRSEEVDVWVAGGIEYRRRCRAEADPIRRAREAEFKHA